MAKVYIQDIASGERELAIKNPYQISSPSWSPDGKFLSLTMYQDGNAEIYILNLKNNVERKTWIDNRIAKLMIFLNKKKNKKILL